MVAVQGSGCPAETGQRTIVDCASSGSFPFTVQQASYNGVTNPAFRMNVNLIVDPPPSQTLTARFTYTCNTRHSCTFDASSSTIPNGLGTLGSYNWSFGDSYQGTTVRLTHDYSGPKTVNVTLKIYDSKLKSSQITQSVVVP
ncbi:MAG: PKD domain-containing protein [Acidobacteriota bacterium]|nr:PKD domain-containing protein [Acidobacteriota bacterium]